MAQVTLTVRDDLVPRILGAFKAHFPIPVDEEENPLYTDAQWFKKCIITHVRYIVKKHEMDEALRIARTTGDLDTDAIE